MIPKYTISEIASPVDPVATDFPPEKPIAFLKTKWFFEKLIKTMKKK